MDVNSQRKQLQNLRMKINNPQKPVSINNGVIRSEKSILTRIQSLAQKSAETIVSEKLIKAQLILEQRKQLMERKPPINQIKALTPISGTKKETKPATPPSTPPAAPKPQKPGCSSCGRKKN